MQIGDTLYSKKDYGRQSWESAQHGSKNRPAKKRKGRKS